MDFTKEYKEVLSGGQEMTVKITATIEGKVIDINESLHIVAEIPRRFAPDFYLALGNKLSEESKNARRKYVNYINTDKG